MEKAMERYEFSEGGSDKFWEVAVDGETLTVRYGRIGTQGQRKDKTFASAEAAEKEKARLIKEKTGKGYTRPATAESGAAAAPASIQSSAPATKTAAASAKPTVAAADAAAPTAVSRVEPPAKSTTESTADDPSPPTRQTVVAEDPPADEPRLVHGTALPTRMRRGAPPEKSPAEAWAAVRDMVRRDLERMQGGAPFPNQDALAAMLETPLAGLPAEQAARWFRVLADTFAPLMGYRHRDGYPAYNALVYDFAHALVDAHGAEYALRLVKLIDNNPHRRAYLEHPWGMAAWPALRAAVVRAPDADYRAALDWALAASARERDAKWHAIWSFLLADDRPEEHHALQFLPLLQAAVAQGIDVGDDVCFVPLLAECPGGADPRWFKKKDYFFYFTYSWVDTADIAATVHAAAAAQGVSPVRVLMWLLDYATEDDRTRLACALLDSREPEALSLLLPKSYDKWIRAGLEQAMDACPRWLFRQLLASYHPGRSEPTVKTRLTKLCQRFDVATLTGWIADLGERGQQTLDKLLATDARFATAEELPSVLRTPPWRKARGKTHADLVIPLQAIPTPFVFEMSDERRAALVESSRQQVWKAVREITTVASVLATVTEAERSIARQKDRPIPEFETPLPNRGVDESELANWVARRATQLLEADIVDGYRHPYHRLIHALPVLPDVIALRLWEQTGLIRSGNCNWWIDEQALLARFGERALPGFLGMLGADPIAGLTALQAVDAHDIAPFAARGGVRAAPRRGRPARHGAEHGGIRLALAADQRRQRQGGAGRRGGRSCRAGGAGGGRGAASAGARPAGPISGQDRQTARLADSRQPVPAAPEERRRAARRGDDRPGRDAVVLQLGIALRRHRAGPRRLRRGKSGRLCLGFVFHLARRGRAGQGKLGLAGHRLAGRRRQRPPPDAADPQMARRSGARARGHRAGRAGRHRFGRGPDAPQRHRREAQVQGFAGKSARKDRGHRRGPRSDAGGTGGPFGAGFRPRRTRRSGSRLRAAPLPCRFR
jgi:predicted DNA-binding WGR domain protein